MPKKESVYAKRKRLGYNPDLIIELCPKTGMDNKYNGAFPVDTVNHHFEDILGITSINGGTNSRVYLKSLITNKIYEMFLTDFNSVIQAKLINNTAIKGTFAFTKRGRYTGIIYINKPKPYEG